MNKTNKERIRCASAVYKLFVDEIKDAWIEKAEGGTQTLKIWIIPDNIFLGTPHFSSEPISEELQVTLVKMLMRYHNKVDNQPYKMPKAKRK